MGYSVIFIVDLGAVPETARGQIGRVFGQVADAVAAIPESSPFFASMDESVLQIDVAGWRLGYRVDRPARELRIIEAAVLRPRAG